MYRNFKHYINCSYGCKLACAFCDKYSKAEKLYTDADACCKLLVDVL